VLNCSFKTLVLVKQRSLLGELDIDMNFTSLFDFNLALVRRETWLSSFHFVLPYWIAHRLGRAGSGVNFHRMAVDEDCGIGWLDLDLDGPGGNDWISAEVK
jgi:hypothetical protein